MDNLLIRLEKLSNDLLQHFQAVSFEELTSFMEEREAIFNEFDNLEVLPSDKIKYRDIVNRIVGLDPIIVTKMEQLKKEAEQELNKVTSGRLQKNAYDGEHHLADGIFFDKKK
ncbi:hypothetical protein EHS13_00640 [Paenibacillus psychroresistens]|uniref:Flagellar protein FliT n=1 Tax=Paenibacillus psychroresistens TaxID=1778678 RepID=A0A6B8RCD9_9BACL|nr:hypothetical protein [Paenibacillus psychroresistens]QGQ93534.1 hypothetical protein EHS13_00640 [Paenibacillus psychroresistens]